jgi:hypothetical protein
VIKIPACSSSSAAANAISRFFNASSRHPYTTSPYGACAFRRVGRATVQAKIKRRGCGQLQTRVIAAAQFVVLDEILGMGVALRTMPYEFTDREYEPEPQASSSRGGVPPRKITGVGVLDPPVPPKRQPGPLTPIPASLLKRIFAVIILVGVAIAAAMFLLARH